jgi:hypothetical protein
MAAEQVGHWHGQHQTSSESQANSQGNLQPLIQEQPMALLGLLGSKSSHKNGI